MAFKRPNTTPTPDELFDIWLPDLTDAELRVLLYIVRKTFGYDKRNGDGISLDQFTNGVTRKKDGKICDRGCGIKCRKNVCQALDSLEKKGLIHRVRQIRADGGCAPTVYALSIEEQEDCGATPTGGSGATPTGGSGATPTGGSGATPTGGSGASATDKKQGNNKQSTTNNQQQTSSPRVRTREAADAAPLFPEQLHEHSRGTEPLEGGEGLSERTPEKTSGAAKGKQGEQLPLPGLQKAGRQESKGQEAAREFLRRVKRYGEIATVPRSWSWSSARKLDEAGPEVFRDFVAWAEHLTWLDNLCPDGKRTYRQAMGIPKFEDLWLEFRALGGGPAAIIPIAPQRVARDKGRITDAPPQASEPTCLCCDRPVGALHDGDCPVVLKGHGPTVEGDHTTWEWMRDNKIRKHRYSVS